MYEQAKTFDLETCTATLNKRKASPFHPDNYIVAAGFKDGDNKTYGTYHSDPDSSRRSGVFQKDALKSTKLLIGFNIKFDLLYTWGEKELQAYFKSGGQIWDCQYVEYLIEGMLQHSQMISMNETIPKYGGTLKLDAVKALWDDGVNTPDIPEDLLMKYLLGDEEEELEGDVNNTWLIFMGQMKRIQKDYPPETLQMIRNRMDGLLATTEMEYNGLMIDIELGEKLQKEQKILLIKLNEGLEKFIPELPPELEFNWNSIYHKSYLIYGGHAKYQKWVHHEDDDGNLRYAKKTEKHYLVDGLPVGTIIPDGTEPDRFKGGKRAGEAKTKNVQVPDLTKPKGAKQDFNHRFKGFTTPELKWKSSLTDGKDNPIYSTSADVIEELAATRSIAFLTLLQQRGKLKKDLGTYYWDEDKNGNRKGMLTLVGEDGIIHHKLNHTSTVTSRLSSSDPNMQNIPKKDKSNVKQLFISRFSNGRMAEIDYSQLEVVVQGILSRDKQLCVDLRNKIDFHCKRLGIKLGESYESVVKAVDEQRVHHIEETTDSAGQTVKVKITYKDLRGDIKSFTFERAYGAGAKSISLNNGIPLAEVEELIRIEENMYPGVIAFDKTVEASIAATRRPTKNEVYIDGQRHHIGRGFWFSPTGTKYVWNEYETPKFLQDRGTYTGFKPTERKNYPIQGTGGEIVQTMVGILWRWLIQNDRFGGQALLVNTVHDCVWLDLASQEIADKVISTACVILESVPEKFNNDFNLHIDVPFPVEAEVGTNMYNLTHYK